ncbi:MAG: hypothetical protein EB829_02090, partial [Nitrosopumilus sp. H8]
VDNSIDARLPKQTENIQVTLDFVRRTISVFDDGAGMGPEDLKNGLTIAMGTKQKGKLGKFGLGMKSACSALGKTFTITTSRDDSDLDYVACYDEYKWLNDSTRNWTNFQIDDRKKTRSWHGTLIEISKLNVPLYPNQTAMFKRDFGIRYGTYLRHGQISLYINTTECRPIEPEIQKDSRINLEMRLGKNSFKGWIGLLARRSIKGDYGVHLYKNYRLIKAYDKFGIRTHPEVAKIIGEVHLDHVPINYQKTDFIRDSLEYKEAEQAFGSHPDVRLTMRNSTGKSLSTQPILSVLEYDKDKPVQAKLKTRMSRPNSRLLLNQADTFNMDGKPNHTVIFKDLDETKLYEIEENLTGHTIKINRKSPVFDIIGNPMFLIGMIKLEAKLALADLKRYKQFLHDRNAAWNQFVKDCAGSREYVFKKPVRAVPLPSYSLVHELVEMHDFLAEKFEFDFQFTALSTLAPFLQHAYNKMIYTIKTLKYTGQQLYDLLLNYRPSEFTIILNPKTGDIEKALEYSEKIKFIVIREHHTVSKKTWAAPAHAWIDLVSEMRRSKYHIGADEIDIILENLLNADLVDMKKLENMCRHKNVLSYIQKYLGDKI